jgi:hypothetical protein
VKRLHSSLDYLTPNQAHNISGTNKKRWKDIQGKKRKKGRSS